MRVSTALFSLLPAILFPLLVTSQNFSFTNYTVEQGLAQSQARDIVQDPQGYLWIPTLGGLSCFDGSRFHNYKTTDGLHSLLTFCVYVRDNKKIYIGQQDGIQSYDGRKFEFYELPPHSQYQAVVNLSAGKDGRIYFTSSAKLFRAEEGKPISQVNDFAALLTTTVYTDRERNLYAAVYKKGIYRLANDQWKLFFDIAKTDTNLIVTKLFFTIQGKFILLTNKGIFALENDRLSLLVSNERIKSVLMAIEEDALGRIWIGTTRGAYLFDGNDIEYVGSSSGLTDNSVFKIVRDREGNLWFATDGDGIFKLNNTPLAYLNSSHGMKGNIVMGIAAEGPDKIWLGTSEGGLQKYENKTFSSFNIASARMESRKINSLFLDSRRQLWIGTLGGGLWIYKNGAYKEILTSHGSHFNEIVSINEDSQKTIWVCISSGVFYFADGTMHRVPGITYACFSVMEVGRDTMLVGSTAGLVQIAGKSVVTKIDIPGTKTGVINCFAKWHDNILLGTEDAGIFFWNRVPGKVIRCSGKNGLSSDFIFSLLVNNDSTIFAGTGHGISKIIVSGEGNNFLVKNFSFPNAPYGPECNLNAVQKTPDGKILFGTTRGLAVYDENNSLPCAASPLIYLTDVKLFSGKVNNVRGFQDTISAWKPIPYNLNLSHNQNQLTFDFTGLYFTNPAALKYRYKLEGADTGYSDFITTPEIIFSNLAPGQYRFKVYAVTEDGAMSSNSIDYPFRIAAPFYQQVWFIILSVLALIATGIFFQYARTKLRQKRENVFKKIRQEEQRKMQERISEDLHDDLGNKITRITVLTDVLSKKTDNSDLEKKKLIEKIKENAAALYLGTKDMIWSLTPGNDSLYDILERSHSFGIHLFDETGIEFKIEGLDDTLKKISVPMQINRNLAMIVKEALNNILKHSDATDALISVTSQNDNGYIVIISDNGRGIKKSLASDGNGLINMEKRASRIGGRLTIENISPSGTAVAFWFKIPPNEG
jgi:signal transduction histidine kinase/ligand-binding sensor domain-containing protein